MYNIILPEIKTILSLSLSALGFYRFVIMLSILIVVQTSKSKVSEKIDITNPKLVGINDIGNEQELAKCRIERKYIFIYFGV